MISKNYKQKHSKFDLPLWIILISYSKYFCLIVTTMTAGYWLFLLTITNEILVICPNFKHVNRQSSICHLEANSLVYGAATYPKQLE